MNRRKEKHKQVITKIFNGYARGLLKTIDLTADVYEEQRGLKLLLSYSNEDSALAPKARNNFFSRHCLAKKKPVYKFPQGINVLQ